MSLKRLLALLACALLLMFTASADGDGVAAPDYATVAIDLPEVDIDAMVAAFYGDQAEDLRLESQVYELGGVSVEVISGSLPDCVFIFKQLY